MGQERELLKPDTIGLPPEWYRLVPQAERPYMPVHLRLTDRKGNRTAGCGGGLGAWWSGVLDEVTCLGCLRKYVSWLHNYIRSENSA